MMNTRKIERTVIRKIARLLTGAGCTIAVGSGLECFLSASTNVRLITEHCLSVDEVMMSVRGPIRGWIFLVMGNDGHDVIADYSDNLEEVLRPVHEYCDKIACACA